MKRAVGELIEERAYRLAIVYLTSRDDLEVLAPTTDSGMDLLIRIHRGDQGVERVFGVQVKGFLSPNGHSHNAAGEWMFRVKPIGSAETATIPLCVFLFFMEHAEGFYKWLQEPTITEQGTAILTLNLTGGFRKLDTEALDIIVAQVNRWYDATAFESSPAGTTDHLRRNAR